MDPAAPLDLDRLIKYRIIELFRSLHRSGCLLVSCGMAGWCLLEEVVSAFTHSADTVGRSLESRDRESDAALQPSPFAYL